MTYFCECFICGSDESDCGHREADLVTWWVGWTIDRCIKPMTLQAPTVVMKANPPVQTLPTKPPALPLRDPAKLSHGRMSWPQQSITRESALSQRSA
jgi:hypothetical protein